MLYYHHTVSDVNVKSLYVEVCYVITVLFVVITFIVCAFRVAEMSEISFHQLGYVFLLVDLDCVPNELVIVIML